MNVKDENLAIILLHKFDQFRVSDKDKEEVERISAPQMDEIGPVTLVIGVEKLGKTWLAFPELQLVNSIINFYVFQYMFRC